MLPKSALSLATILLLSVTSLQAMKFETLGYKSISMGGAAVASSSGSLATYNNPALLGKTPYTVEVSLSGGVSESDYGAGASVAKLDDIGFMDTIDKAVQDVNSLTTADKQNLIDGTDIVMGMNGESITIAPQASLGVQISGFGFGMFGSSDAVATAVVDETYNQLIFENSSSLTGYSILNTDGTVSDSSASEYTASSIDYAINNGLTYLDVVGVVIGEVPVAYGHNFETNIGNVMIGGALKYMQATTYTQKMKPDNSGNITGTTGQKLDKTSSSYGVDLGLAYQPALDYDLTLGLVGKNLNSPEFDYYNGRTYTLDPLVRAGIDYKIFDSLEIAADIDLTSNKTLNSEVDSKMVGGGINYEPFTSLFALSLRAGLMENLAKNDNTGLIYTAGLGIGLKWFQIDLSGEMSGNSDAVQGTTVPQYAKVNVALVSRW